MKKLLAILSVVLFANQISAEGHGVYTVIGFGANNCSSFSEIYDTNDTPILDQYKQWIMGYISAINHKAAMDNLTFDKGSNPKLGKGKAEAFLLVMYYYCKANPVQTFNDAANYLVEQLELESQ